MNTFKRGSGILLHISSLPSPYGIGDLGPEAFQFVDLLAEAKQHYWQLLPLNPTNTVYGNSPYSSVSAFAANILFISPELLVKEGWIESKDIASVPVFPGERVDYEAVTKYKIKLFDRAYKNFKKSGGHLQAYQDFCSQHSLWLEDYALFLVIKKSLKGASWTKWPQEFRVRQPKALKEIHGKFAEEIEKVKFLQFIVFKQWHDLKDYCQQKNVKLIGDIPIYVNDDSADVWANPSLFKLSKEGKLIFVAGVPPDYFSETGQRWGNPVYDWEEIKKTGYDWWVKRVQHNLSLFDVIRIDHFRGLVDYWQIPSKCKTAIEGEWVKGPGDDFLSHLKKVFPVLPIIAEDLGIITPEVTETMERFNLPGMKVFLFAFGGDLETHPYLPKNYAENCIIYTGTHDNNTVKGWLDQDATEHEKKNLVEFLGKEIDEKTIHWELIQQAIESVADVAIFPLQDILGLGNEARMNTPATKKDNWEWRLLKDKLTPVILSRLSQMTETSTRI